MGHPLRCGGLVNATMRFAPWPRPYIGAARRLRELPYKPAAAQVHFRLAAFAAPFAARVHAAVDIRIRAASIISFPLGALRGGRPNSLLTGNFSKKNREFGPNSILVLFSLIKWSRLGEGQASTSFFFVDGRAKPGHDELAGRSRTLRSSELQRLALALLVPEAGLARIAVFRAGRVPLEKAVPRDGDLVGAVRVLFQHVARDVAGPGFNIQQLLRPEGERITDQEDRDRKARREPVRKHGVTS